jgi:hypothetical protein
MCKHGLASKTNSSTVLSPRKNRGLPQQALQYEGSHVAILARYSVLIMLIPHFSCEACIDLRKTLLAITVDRIKPLLLGCGVPANIVTDRDPIKRLVDEYLEKGQAVHEQSDVEFVFATIESEYGEETASDFLVWARKHCLHSCRSCLTGWAFFFRPPRLWQPSEIREKFPLVSEIGCSRIYEIVEDYFGVEAHGKRVEVCEQIEKIMPEEYEREITIIDGIEPKENMNLVLFVSSCTSNENAYRALTNLRRVLQAADWKEFLNAARKTGPLEGLAMKDIDLVETLM